LGEREEPHSLGSNIIVIGVDGWDGFVRKEAVVSFVEHMGGIIAEDWLRLDVKAMHHGITVSLTHHLYDA
jgi:hypothetical protein